MHRFLTQRLTRRRPRHRAGFTLIELLLVLAILVILAGLVGPRILGSQQKADIRSTKAQLAMFKTTLEHYALDMRTFPETEEGLEALIKKPADSDDSDNWGGPYLDSGEIPKDPWGNEYQYEFPPSHSDREEFPDIWSLGPDGDDGTDDDIVNWVTEEREDKEGPGTSTSTSSSTSSGTTGGTKSSSSSRPTTSGSLGTTSSSSGREK
ncbi:MAG: type II secretion system protein GspG [Planctomycetes bacterium RBG_16_64_10]|nr:MAG: type II secretion system protein GspG [Planctomycetes bacterium RBG_16_64_10]